MESIKELYKIGNGPSSSHTMGPKEAAEIMKKQYPEADSFKVILYGSLALTGKGHLTDYIIKEVLKPLTVEIIFDKQKECKVHPNTMDIIAYQNKKELGAKRFYSIGGGTVQIEGEENKKKKEIYQESSFREIRKYCEENNKRLYEYVYEQEDESIHQYLKTIWETMKQSVEYGLKQEGTIPGRLQLKKTAKSIYENKAEKEDDHAKQIRLLSAYAYSVSETNASGGVIVTAPTCGSSGVVPAVLYYLQKEYQYSDEQIVRALATAGLIGNLVKQNASISGAECGCQAEIGTACSMAAAAYAELKGMDIYKIERAAEIAMEHHLGLTCDPIYGYVQIPCIQRNAVAAMRAIDACELSELLLDRQKINFDLVVETMYETGKDLSQHYRETSEGGLAKKYCRNKFYNKEMI